MDFDMHGNGAEHKDNQPTGSKWNQKRHPNPKDQTDGGSNFKASNNIHKPKRQSIKFKFLA